MLWAVFSSFSIPNLKSKAIKRPLQLIYDPAKFEYHTVRCRQMINYRPANKPAADGDRIYQQAVGNRLRQVSEHPISRRCGRSSV